MRTPVTVPASVERWRTETARMFLVSPAKALAAARRAAVEARRVPRGVPREAARAIALDAAGIAAHAAGRYARAAAHYARAATLYKKLGLTRECARTRKNRIDPLQYLHRIGEALTEGRRACVAFERLNDRGGLGRTLMNLAILEQRRDRPARALEMYARARRLFQALDDVPNLALCALNEAVARTSIDDFRRALELFEEARAAYRRAGLRMPEAEADFDESWVRVLLGDYRRALELLERARGVFVSLRDPVRAAVLDLDRAETLLLLNRPDEAATVVEAALAIFRKSRIRAETGRARALAGEAHAELGEVARAATDLRRATAQLDAQGNRSGAARASLALARVELGRARPARACARAAAAARKFRAAGLVSRAAEADLLRAGALLAMGRAASAARLVRGVARRAARLPAETSARAEHLRGRILWKEGRRGPAYRAMTRSIAAIERVRVAVPGSIVRAGWLEDKLGVYEDALALSLERGSAHGLADAFHHAEQARARTFADRISSQAPLAQSSPASNLLSRYVTLREEARWLAGRIAREGERAASPLLPGRRTAAALKKRESQLAALLPRIQALDETDRAFALPGRTLESELRGLLAPDQALIEYFVRETETIAFLLDSRGLRCVRLAPGRAALARAVHELRFEWDRFLLGGDYLSAHRAEAERGAARALAKVHSLIFRALESEGLPRRLVIVPSGPLHDVPFAALRSEGGSLLERHEITIAPSGQAWRSGRLRADPAPPGLSADAPPLIMGLGAEELPHAPEECAAVARCWIGSSALVGPAATLAAFRSHAPSSPLIHLAAHAAFRGDDPLLSSIRLSDAPVNLHELHDLRLRARLVVLSGCQTARAHVAAGEELMGLSIGFLRAGARSVLVSLWSVDDVSTADFMGAFHSRLAEGVSPSRALREAMLAHRQRHPHPYYWAPFLLMGAD